MNRFESRRRQRVVVMFLAAMMALPPGASRVFAASRTSTHTRISSLETFRNPQISGGLHNRFLYSQSASRLIGGGGDSGANVQFSGYGRDDSPLGVWLPEGRMVWDDTDMPANLFLYLDRNFGY